MSVHKLKKIEYKEGAKLAYINYQELIAVAEMGAKSERYATSTSLCILAMEELAKSIILQLKAINNAIPVNNLDKYFSCHKTKHIAGVNFFMSFKIEGLQENDKVIDDKQIILIIVAFIAIIVTLKIKGVDLKETSKKSYFDIIKESGFYLGYDKKSKKWLSPQAHYDKEFFDSMYQLVLEFSEQVYKWIFEEELNNENILDFLNSLDDEIIDKERLKKVSF